MTQAFCVSFFLPVFVDYSFFSLFSRSYSTCQGDASCNWRRTEKRRGFNSPCSAHFRYQLYICARSLSLSSREVWMRRDFTNWLWESREIWKETWRCVKLKKVSRNLFCYFMKSMCDWPEQSRRLTLIIRKEKFKILRCRSAKI